MLRSPISVRAAASPGLVLALELSASHWQLVDRGRARADWLTRSVGRLGLQDRVTVRHEPAEVTGRGPLRGMCGAVVARQLRARRRSRPSAPHRCCVSAATR